MKKKPSPFGATSSFNMPLINALKAVCAGRVASGKRKAEMKCQAIIEDFANGKSFSGLRRPTTVPLIRPCSFNAKKKLGRLALCQRHVELAREGFVEPDGSVTGRTDRQNYQRGLVPGRPNVWANGLTPEDLLPEDP